MSSAIRKLEQQAHKQRMTAYSQRADALTRSTQLYKELLGDAAAANEQAARETERQIRELKQHERTTSR